MPKRSISAVYDTDENPSKKTWDFTIFWKLETELEEIMETLKLWQEDCTRMRIAKELTEDGREHLQCKLTWRVPKRWPAMKKLLGPIHFEVSIVDCFSYCGKMGSNVLVNHDGRRQGQRCDLKACMQDIKDGATEWELWEKHPSTMIRYKRNMMGYMAQMEKRKLRPKAEVVWLHGRDMDDYVEETYPDAYYVQPDGNGNLWWDDYDSRENKTVVFQGLTESMVKYDTLCRILAGRGKYRCGTKGGSVWLQAERFVITCATSPEYMWKALKDTRLRKAVTEVHRCPFVLPK